MKEKIEKLVSENTLNFGKCKTLEDYAELENNFVNKLLEAINYSQCCIQLKTKKAPTFEHWLICNFEETSTGNYIDFNNGVTYRDKQVLKLKYNKIFKPSL